MIYDLSFPLKYALVPLKFSVPLLDLWSLNNKICSIGGTYFFEDADILWPGGTSKPPLGRPSCGWNNEFCQEDDPGKNVFTIDILIEMAEQ